jgi:hypothetical protein
MSERVAIESADAAADFKRNFVARFAGGEVLQPKAAR